MLLFVLFAGAFSAMAIVNLLIADRLSPVTFSANVHPAVERFHDFFGRRLRLFRIIVAVVIGMLFAAPAIGRWQEWLMFRNSKSFGISDPQFHHDIGFYLFKLPFVTFLLDWLFAALIFITLLTLATHILNGGIVFAQPRPRVRNSAKAHIAVLLAALALVKAGRLLGAALRADGREPQQHRPRRHVHRGARQPAGDRAARPDRRCSPPACSCRR